ncbi:MAG: FAD-dependent oxidoreductase [Novosphingobium sp.]|nr:FAD-dependent oxidoreductase [Novosphingobium sp.]
MVREAREGQYRTQVLIVGAGMVGMTAALDLAQRGVDVLIVEKGPLERPMVPRANHLSARTMEIFHRLGIAGKVRAKGLPDDFANDVVFVTGMSHGHELARLRIPSREKRFNSVGYIDSHWPTPQPAHRCNQMYFEPVVREEVLANPRITTIFDAQIADFEQDADGVTAKGVDEDGASFEVRADYLVGCDGGSSTIRKKIGAVFEGVDVISRNRMALIRAPQLLGRLVMEPAWMTWFIRPEGHGTVHAIDGKELWCFHCNLPDGEEDFEELDRDRIIQSVIGTDIPYEIVHTEDWYGRRLIASSFAEGRVFLAGDAAHIWIPMAGYGMNAGVADVTNLTWKLAAVENGWADPAILDSYALERRPVTTQVSKHVAKLAVVNYGVELRKDPPPALFEEGSAGDAERAKASQFLIDANMGQFNCAGLNFGAVYESGIVVPDGEDAPPFELADYVPSTVPGCRTPYFTLADGASLYDQMGLGFTLLRTDPSVDVGPVVAAAGQRGVPLTVLDIDAVQAGGLYDHKLVLSRPDQYVAWRGDAVPEDALALIDTVRGARPGAAQGQGGSASMAAVE